MPTQPALTLRFLGSGSAFSPVWGTTCAVLGIGDARWLVDCGRQAPEQLKAAGLDWHDLDGQLVTHVHGDHVFGLEEFALVRFYRGAHGRAPVVSGGRRPWLLAHSAVRSELWEVLGPTLRYMSDPAGRPCTGKLEDYFRVAQPTSVEGPRHAAWNHAERFDCDGLRVTARETRHVVGKPSVSFEIELGAEQGHSVAWWSGDAVLEPDALRAMLARTQVYFHDCTWRTFPGQVHASFDALAALEPALRSRIVLMHLDDDVLERRDQVRALGFRLALPGDVFDLSTGQRVQRGPGHG